MIIIHPELKKTAYFWIILFLLNLGSSIAWHVSDALMISRLGTSPLIYVYLISAFVSIFYTLFSSRSAKGPISFQLLIFAILLTCIVFVYSHFKLHSQSSIFLSACVSSLSLLINLKYWIFCSDYFSGFEARRIFPKLLVAGLIGDICGSLLLSLYSTRSEALTLIYIWPLAIFVASFIALGIKKLPQQMYVLNSVEKKQDGQTWKMVFVMLGFWAFFFFFSYLSDYRFNEVVLNYFISPSKISSYFGLIFCFSSALILIYQVFFSRFFIHKFGFEKMVQIIPFFLIAVFLFDFFQSNLLSASFNEIFVHYFLEYMLLALFLPTLNLFRSSQKQKVKLITEGLSQAMAVFALLIFVYFLKVENLAFVLVCAACALVLFQFIFKRVYYSFLIENLNSDDRWVKVNSIEAIGQNQNRKADDILRTLLTRTEDISLKRMLVLSLGQLQSDHAFREIIELFSLKEESMQLAVLDSISHYQNYEGMYALIKMLNSSEMVSNTVRLNAAFLVTKLIGKKMIPFLMQTLERGNEREIANALESIALLKDPKTLSFVVPFLKHSHHRIRSSAIIACYPFYQTQADAELALDVLLNSNIEIENHAGIYTVGVLRLKKHKRFIRHLLDSTHERTLLHACVALAQMKDSFFCKTYLKLLLSEDQTLALDAAKKMSLFPSYSKLLLFEAISKLKDSTHKEKIISILEQSHLDFTREKKLLEEA